jgi:hypothetical protein
MGGGHHVTKAQGDHLPSTDSPAVYAQKLLGISLEASVKTGPTVQDLLDAVEQRLSQCPDPHVVDPGGYNYTLRRMRGRLTDLHARLVKIQGRSGRADKRDVREYEQIAEWLDEGKN